MPTVTPSSVNTTEFLEWVIPTSVHSVGAQRLYVATRTCPPKGEEGLPTRSRENQRIRIKPHSQPFFVTEK